MPQQAPPAVQPVAPQQKTPARGQGVRSGSVELVLDFGWIRPGLDHFDHEAERAGNGGVSGEQLSEDAATGGGAPGSKS